jgi:hypothetical protein
MPFTEHTRDKSAGRPVRRRPNIGLTQHRITQQRSSRVEAVSLGSPLGTLLFARQEPSCGCLPRAGAARPLKNRAASARTTPRVRADRTRAPVHYPRLSTSLFFPVTSFLVSRCWHRPQVIPTKEPRRTDLRGSGDRLSLSQLPRRRAVGIARQIGKADRPRCAIKRRAVAGLKRARARQYPVALPSAYPAM